MSHSPIFKTAKIKSCEELQKVALNGYSYNMKAAVNHMELSSKQAAKKKGAAAKDPVNCRVGSSAFENPTCIETSA